MKAISSVTINRLVMVTFTMLFGMAVNPELAELATHTQQHQPESVSDVYASPAGYNVEGGLFVDPDSITITLELGQSITVPLTLTNGSDGAISWEVQEDAPWLSEDPINGILPGREPPSASMPDEIQAVLFDNGPLSTHPGGGSGGADASAVQTDLDLSTYGFRHDLASGYRVADDFVVTGAGWNIDSITFYAYQTNSGTASTINHVNLRIWDGIPDAPGSHVVWGDTTTNLLANTTWSSIYRVLDYDLQLTNRPIMADTAAVGVTLTPGQYWLDWQTGGTLTSGPYAPPISILGQATTGDALIFDPARSLWNPAVDGEAGSVQGFPFLIEGDPMAASQVVEVIFDAGAVSQMGVYTADLVFENDGETGDITVLLTMTVNAPAGWGELQGTVTSLGYCDANPTLVEGAEVIVTTSTGITYTLTTDAGGAFWLGLPAAEGPVDIAVTAPEHTTSAVSGVEIIAGGTTTQDMDLRWLQPCINSVPDGFDIEVKEGYALNQQLMLFNQGAISTTYQIEESFLDTGGSDVPWLRMEPITGTLAADSSAEIDVTFDSMTYTVGTQLMAMLEVKSDDPFTNTIQIPVTMTIAAESYAVNIGEDQAMSGHRAETVTYLVAVTNTSHGLTDIFDITLGGNEWTTTAPGDVGPLAAGANQVMEVAVTIPEDAMPGDIDEVVVTATSQGDPLVSDLAILTTTAAGEYAVMIEPAVAAQSGAPGEVVTYTLAVTNTGDFADKYGITVASTWQAHLPVAELTLGAEESANIAANVIIPADAVEGDRDIATISVASITVPENMDKSRLVTTAQFRRVFLPVVVRNQAQ